MTVRTTGPAATNLIDALPNYPRGYVKGHIRGVLAAIGGVDALSFIFPERPTLDEVKAMPLYTKGYVEGYYEALDYAEDGLSTREHDGLIETIEDAVSCESIDGRPSEKSLLLDQITEQW